MSCRLDCLSHSGSPTYFGPKVSKVRDSGQSPNPCPTRRRDGNSYTYYMLSGPARLITRSSTTGWLDWVHGDLWLGQNGLLRVRSNWRRTILNSFRWLVRLEDSPPNPRRSSQTPPHNQIEGVVWIARDEILRASLHRGILNDRLRLELQNGSLLNLLWLRGRQPTTQLASAMREWLGDNLEQD
jgi:hypothetical protein